MTMKKLILISILNLALIHCSAQETKFEVYNPAADASLQLSEAVQKAQAEQKHILVQIGGNWCKWCRLFYKWSHENTVIDSIIKSDYEVVHLNYSKENKNAEALKKFGYPQRFGFPVFLVLDENGKLIHTQNSAHLEEGQGYSEKLVKEFLLHWNRNALDPKNY
jgi:thioredoxin-related protein